MNRKSLLTLLLVFLSPIVMRAQKDDFVLIITSFQIELNNYQTNISEFYTEINRENPDILKSATIIQYTIKGRFMNR